MNTWVVQDWQMLGRLQSYRQEWKATGGIVADLEGRLGKKAVKTRTVAMDRVREADALGDAQKGRVAVPDQCTWRHVNVTRIQSDIGRLGTEGATKNFLIWTHFGIRNQFLHIPLISRRITTFYGSFF
ncbi:hypothetical protein K438DRAFT_1778384 [Mycena galopus ATCC 62051]|nr:hypothetical protein K438DRAFT_1778384 [Mycena galopus ATCC 62051]